MNENDNREWGRIMKADREEDLAREGDDDEDRKEHIRLTALPVNERHATWRDWPHVGECYRVRNRGGKSAFSREGFLWTDSYAKAVDRPSIQIRFHGGPNDGMVTMMDKTC